MRIGVSARWLELPPGGAREYTECLVRALLEYDRNNEYVVFYTEPRRIGTFPAATEIVLSAPNKIIWDYVTLPNAIRRSRIDLFWTPSYVVPFPVTCRSVATVLDLAYFTMPRSYQFHDVLYMQLAMPGSFRRASALLCISEYTRQDLVRLFPFTREKVAVTPLGISSRYRKRPPAEIANEVRLKHSLSHPYIFYAGSLSPRKGIPELLRAFAVLKRDRCVPHRLVLTGGWSWGNVGVQRMIDALGLQEEVTILGEVPPEDMPVLYRLADLFVYPSLYEGFGLPVLEAMACECPVVCSNLTSLPEVAGDAAILVEPTSPGVLAEAMYRALSDEPIRAALRVRGVQRAEKYTWHATAEKTLKVFEGVARGDRTISPFASRNESHS